MHQRIILALLLKFYQGGDNLYGLMAYIAIFLFIVLLVGIIAGQYALKEKEKNKKKDLEALKNVVTESIEKANKK